MAIHSMPNNPIAPHPLFSFSSPRYHYSLLNQSDYDLFRSLYSNKRIMKHIGKPLGLNSTAALFAHILKQHELVKTCESTLLFWTIQPIKTNNIAGIQGFIKKPGNPCEAEFGIMLQPGYQQEGIANESIPALINYGFNALKFDKLFANYSSANTAARRLAENINFNIVKVQNQPDREYCWLTRQAFMSQANLL